MGQNHTPFQIPYKMLQKYFCFFITILFSTVKSTDFLYKYDFWSRDHIYLVIIITVISRRIRREVIKVCQDTPSTDWPGYNVCLFDSQPLEFQSLSCPVSNLSLGPLDWDHVCRVSDIKEWGSVLSSLRNKFSVDTDLQRLILELLNRVRRMRYRKKLAKATDPNLCVRVSTGNQTKTNVKS